MTPEPVSTPVSLSDYYQPQEGISLTELCDSSIIIHSVEEFESERYGKGVRVWVSLEDDTPDFERGGRYLAYTFSKAMVEALCSLADAFRADPELSKRGVRARVTKHGRRYVLR